MAELANRWYLIWISKKYELDTHKFLECFLDAWSHEKSLCKDIALQCRQKTETDGVFLITQDRKVIAQLHLTKTALERLADVDLTCYPWNQSIVENTKNSGAMDLTIKDVNLTVKRVNLKANVINKSTMRTVYSRFGISHHLSTATISDSTGSIKLPLWNAQIDMVSVGDTIHIQNGRVRMFRGELQVNVSKDGKLNVIPNEPTKYVEPQTN